MIKILLVGCSGMMGKTITNLVNKNNNFKITAGVNSSGTQNKNYKVYYDFNNIAEEFDVIIDFSDPEGTNNLLKYATNVNKPIVLATTGHSKDQIELIHNFSEKIPIFLSSNTSIGINLILDIVKKCVNVFQNDFDIEIIEKHHNKKKDSPSGTAIKIADAINEVSNFNYDYTFDRYLRKEIRSKNELGIHSIRGGTIIGEHSVIFAGDDEVIEIKHTALSKKIFAKGALKAAMFMVDKSPGIYSMDHLLTK